MKISGTPDWNKIRDSGDINQIFHLLCEYILKIGFPNQEIIKQLYIVGVCVERFTLQEKAENPIILHDF